MAILQVLPFSIRSKVSGEIPARRASSTLLSAYGYGAPQTVTFGGLTPGAQYNLYAINNSNSPGRATTFTTGNPIGHKR